MAKNRKEMLSLRKQYLTAQEVAEAVGVSTGKAYGLIREMNAELKEKGYIVISGKVPISFFQKKYYGFKEAEPEINDSQRVS